MISFQLAHDLSRGLLKVYLYFNHFNGLSKDSISLFEPPALLSQPKRI